MSFLLSMSERDKIVDELVAGNLAFPMLAHRIDQILDLLKTEEDFTNFKYVMHYGIKYAESKMHDKLVRERRLVRVGTKDD